MHITRFVNRKTLTIDNDDDDHDDADVNENNYDAEADDGKICNLANVNRGPPPLKRQSVSA